MLVSGRARVVKAGRGGEEISLNVLRPGDSFGEMALLDNTTRAATVRASSDVEVFRLDKSLFNALVETHPDIHKYLDLHIRHRSLQNFFRLYSPFARASVRTRLSALLEELEVVTAEKGELVVRQGDEPGAALHRRRGPAARLHGGERAAAIPGLSAKERLLRRDVGLQRDTAHRDRRGRVPVPACSG